MKTPTRPQRIFSARQHAERAICYRNSVRLSVCPSHGWISGKRLKLVSCNFHRTVADPFPVCGISFIRKFRRDPPSGGVNEGGLGKRANIVDVLTLSAGGSASWTVRIAVEEAKFTVNRQVAALSRANPGVSSAFLFN